MAEVTPWPATSVAAKVRAEARGTSILATVADANVCCEGLMVLVKETLLRKE